MAKLVPAYTSDKGDRMYSLRSQAIAADIDHMAKELTETIVGDNIETRDDFRNCRYGLLVMLQRGVSPRSLQRKYRRLYNLYQNFLQAKQEERDMQAKDIPF